VVTASTIAVLTVPATSSAIARPYLLRSFLDYRFLCHIQPP
jgi:hypothetical protein